MGEIYPYSQAARVSSVHSFNLQVQLELMRSVNILKLTLLSDRLSDRLSLRPFLQYQPNTRLLSGRVIPVCSGPDL